MTKQILIVDDEKVLAVFLKKTLENSGYQVNIAYNLQSARELIELQLPDLLILDLNLPDGNGLDFYRTLCDEETRIPTIIITAFASIDSAIKAIKSGVDDYLVKPFDPQQVQLLISNLMERYELRSQLNYYRQKSGYGPNQNFFISNLPQMEELQQLAIKIAQTAAGTVLIQGPTGCGKEMLARFIHNMSPVPDSPFIDINCAGLSDTLLESELFGHEPGAFTDARTRKSGLAELAHGGTLFLDEISETSIGLQAKLLRFIETRTFRRVGGTRDIHVEMRIIAATNKNLSELVKQKLFREDLFFRLNLFELNIPALNERREEIPLIAQFFLEKINRMQKKNIKSISPETRTIIERYHWPGNLRELYNILERAAILCEGDTIEPDHLPREIRDGRSASAKSLPTLDEMQGSSLKEYLTRIEKSLLIQALKKSKGNQQKAAHLLNEPRHVIRYMMQRYNLL